MSHYTEDDVTRAESVYVDCAIAEDCHEWPDGPSTMRAILDAVAPAIAARALREIANDLPWTYDQTSGLPDHAERLAAWVNRRADEIEGKP